MPKCPRCNGFLDGMPHYTDNGVCLKQSRCVLCGEIICIKEPLEAPAPERRTGRGKDSHRRQSYGRSKLIRPEDWILPNSALADLYGLATTTISHNRPNKRACRHRGRLGYPEK
jgi:hypothetical protein